MRGTKRGLSEARESESGTILVFVAMILVVFMGMAAFVVDFGWLHWNGIKIQHGADAAALAGVVSAGNQTAEAKDAAAENRFQHLNPCTTVTPVENENQLAVTIIREVPTFFMSMFGIDRVTVERRAVAEYSRSTTALRNEYHGITRDLLNMSLNASTVPVVLDPGVVLPDHVRHDDGDANFYVPARYAGRVLLIELRDPIPQNDRWVQDLPYAAGGLSCSWSSWGEPGSPTEGSARNCNDYPGVPWPYPHEFLQIRVVLPSNYGDEWWIPLDVVPAVSPGATWSVKLDSNLILRLVE